MTSDHSPGVPAHPFDLLQDLIYVLDAEERFTFVNAFGLQLWGREDHEILGRRLSDGPPPPLGQETVGRLRDALRTQERAEFEVYSPEEHRWLGVTVSPNAGGIVVYVRPLSRNPGAPAPLERDDLTGCLTRGGFLARHQDLALPGVLAVIDLNRLKSVNDLQGHSGGDLHIRRVARTLLRHLPPETLVCRWGGDEFVVLHPGEDGSGLQVALARAQADSPSPLPDVPAFSVGTAVWQAHTPFERAFAVADEQLQQHKQPLSGTGSRDTLAFVAFSQYLESLREPEDIMQRGLEQLLALLDFDNALFVPWQDEHGLTPYGVARAGMPLVLPPVDQPPVGLAAQLYRTGQTTWSTDYPSEPVNTPTMVEGGVKSVILTPVRSQGRIIGILSLTSLDRWHPITPHVRYVVELAALRLEHALELRRVAQEVRSTLEAGLLGLGVALEARDLETHGHTQRVSRLAVRLGTALGLHGRELDHLQEGAFLHDLGKLAIPDAILQKPGRLTPEEWEQMKTHTVRGWELASRIPNLTPEVLEVIRHHHERWDGQGYPDSLKSEAIPRLARIFAVCDVYDALISLRPYKAPWSVGAALQEIQAQGGRQFDPQIVDVFVELMEEA